MESKELMKLIVGTDSTWSLRAWMCAQIAGVETDLQVIDLADPLSKQNLLAHSAVGLVPVLKTQHTTIHDSLAIAEYFQEHSDGKLYPVDKSDRALARSLCAELHAGFMALRSNFPFTMDCVAPVSDIQGKVQSELNRVEQIFSSATFPFMFDRESAVDAFYAILAFRLHSYGIVFEGEAGKYQQSLLDWPLLKQAINEAAKWNANSKN